MKAKAPLKASEYVYKAIKEWIMSGELAPEMRIDQDAIAERLGVSRMPIRTALEKLEAEDLVVIHPHRGAQVKRMSKEHLDDLYLVRCHLEKLAVKLATEKMEAHHLEQLNNMIQDQKRLATHANADMEEILAVNREFHMYIYKLAQSPVLLTTIERLWDQSERYRRIFFKQPRLVDGSVEEHKQLIQLMSMKKAEEASEFLVKHNQKTHAVVVQVMNL